MDSFAELLRELGSLSWDRSGFLNPEVPRLLGCLAKNPWLVHEEIRSWEARGLEERSLLCHETATHYKWFIHYHERKCFKVWLHQYKPLGERAPGHAEVPHNHPYSLASLILRGGFQRHFFEKHDGCLAELGSERQSLRAGDVYTVHWQRVHKLSGLRDDTLTLVVESPAVRHYSEAFYGDGAGYRRFYDFPGMHSSLCRETASL